MLLLKKSLGLIRLFRPELPLAAGVCVFTGQILALGRLPSWQSGILAFLTVFCISASALIFNDYFDYEVDKINAPQRPLPSRLVSRSDVLILGCATTAVGLFAAAALGLETLLFSLFLWFIGFLYNWRFKQTGFLGNLMVCISVAATFVFGAVTVQAPWNGVVWTFSLIAFFLDLGEEIAGDAMDMEGDKKINSRSIAILKGRSFAIRLSVALWGIVILLSLVPIFAGWLGLYYLIFILLIDGLLIFFSIKLLKSKDADEGHKAMRGAYMGVTLCVLVFLVCRLLN